jgi:hypothetical protein
VLVHSTGPTGVRTSTFYHLPVCAQCSLEHNWYALQVLRACAKLTAGVRSIRPSQQAAFAASGLRSKRPFAAYGPSQHVAFAASGLRSKRPSQQAAFAAYGPSQQAALRIIRPFAASGLRSKRPSQQAAFAASGLHSMWPSQHTAFAACGLRSIRPSQHVAFAAYGAPQHTGVRSTGADNLESASRCRFL